MLDYIIEHTKYTGVSKFFIVKNAESLTEVLRVVQEMMNDEYDIGQFRIHCSERTIDVKKGDLTDDYENR